MKGKISKRLLSLILAVIMVLSVVPMSATKVEALDSRIENAVNWAIAIANDNSHGYSQSNRLGNPDYDCSSLVGSALNQAGFNVPRDIVTWTMYDKLTKAGFKRYKISDVSLQRGDILWRTGHTEIYIGNNKMVGAHRNYNGISGGIGGNKWWSEDWKCYFYGSDEISVIGCDKSKWSYVFRYEGEKTIPLPGTPAINYVEQYNVPVGKSVLIGWTAASNAAGYAVSINGGNEIKIGNTTSYPLELPQVGNYSIKVVAYNSDGKNGSWSSSVSVTAHSPSTVTFVDWDGKVLGEFDVPYGGNATAPAIPDREGYTFRQWSDSYYNVTSDKIITAIYKINTYTVNFRGYKGDIISTQRVDYKNNATPPDPQTPNGYVFLGWNSEDYKNVYTEDASKTIDIQGVYQWANKELPIVCTITSAKRQDDGYYVYFDLENKIDEAQKGRAVVALKTSSGKLVDMTESAAFSIAKNSTKSGIEVFIPSSSAASKVEVIIVADYATGVPISPLSTCTTIYNADNWSDWTDGTAPAGSQSESRTLYRYRDKEFSTGNTKTKSGWTYTGVRNETLIRDWTPYSDTVVSNIDNEQLRREVRTQSVPVYGTRTAYVYYHFYKKNGGNHTFCPTNHAGGTYHGVYYSYSQYTWYKYSDCGKYNMYKGDACPECGATQYWFYNAGDTIQNQQYISHYKTQYSYREYQYTYNFYSWKPWSEWSIDSVVKTDNREIETKTQYRTMGTDAGVENDAGTWYNKPIDLPTSLAGKQITMSVYGYTGASDYTNFYIGQQQLDGNGDCTFKFKLREELSTKTGDLTVAIGVEGTDYMQIIDILEAPKPKYTVKFYDWYGNVISEQTVTEGEDAVLPETPEKEGYTFIGWDRSITNIKADTEIYADYEKKEYTVVFVDWQNQLLEIQKYEHGAVLVAPEIDSIKGYTFNGWDKINDGKIIVTQDMVVYAEHEIKEYTVKFYDFDGNVIDTQVVKYGDEAEEPEVPDGENGEKFAGWFNPEDYQYVDGDVHIYPSFCFDETTELPEVNYHSGEYNNAIELTLTTPDENAVIYYYLGNDQSTEAIYTGPITIDKTTTITYYATSFGKNDSESVTGYYCINSDEISGWMLQSELPADVTANPDDYVVESAKGYRYKDTQSTELVSVYKPLLNSGWKWESSKWSDYTVWQDSEIVADSKYIEFEVDTREVDDTSVTWYKYTRYKYTDSNGTVQYAPTAVEGYDCVEETLRIPDKLSIAGFLDDDVTTYYEYNGERWFKRASAPGLKTQYRSRYKICTYYKWTEWGTTAPVSGETRVYETNTVYRYSVQNYHIVDIIDGFGDMPMTSLVKHGSVIDTSSLETEGYIFNGLYTDEALTKSFGATTPITARVTLYAKYTPKKYTVRFQMQDGTEVETQTVNYFEAAVEPDVDSVPGWTFVRWDKDFDCITGDMVITGKYIKTAEYAYINLDRTSVDMYQGMSFTLAYLITPVNLANETVEWSTSDPSIATVDDKGKVTAVSAGEVTITATVVKSRETATCKINVTADKANFIVLKSDTYLGYDSLGYLRGVKLKTTTSSLSREFANATLKYKNMDGVELSENSLVSTGSTIMLYNGSKLVDCKSVVVTGDVYPDGTIGNKDVALMLRVMLNKATVEECQRLAMDVNGDGSINNRDAAMVARYMVGKENF